MERNSEGKIVITDPKQAVPFCEEDLIYMGVPVGRLTYGYGRIRIGHLHGIRSIGRFCSIAPDVSVPGMHHPLEWVSTNPFLYRTDRGMIRRRPRMPEGNDERNDLIEIGHDVWIAERATILRPCVLGHGCVVAAGALVTKDVPPYAIVAGVPARVLRYRLPEDLIPRMLEIAWWDWDLEKIRLHADDFYDPAAFVAKHHPSGGA